MRNYDRRLAIGMVAALGIALSSVGVAQAEPVRIRAGWANMPHHMIPVLFSKPEILKHYGKTYVVEPVQFRGSSAQIPALAAKQLDVGVSAASAFALAVNNANVEMKVLADVIQDGVEGYGSDAFLVRKDSGIETVKDLRGKRIGTNGIGSFTDTVQRVMYMKAGLKPEDYTMVEASFANMPTMIAENKLDLVPTIQPFRDQMMATGNYKILYDQGDAMGPTNGTFLAGRAEFINENKQAMYDFMEDYVRASRWFHDPKNRDEVLTIISTFMKQPKESLSSTFTKADYYRDPYMIPNVPNIQKVIDVPNELGLSDVKLKLEPNYVATEYVEEAKRRIEANP